MIKHAWKLILISAIAISLMIGSPAAATMAGAAEKPAPLTRINFAAGATSATVTGRMDANGRTRYVLRAGVRQLLDVTLTGPDGASLVVRRRNGTLLSGYIKTSTTFRGHTPNAGDFILDVYTGARGGAYTLFVSIPEKVAFQPNTTSDLVEGELAAYESHEYSVRAAAGQVLDVSVETDLADTEGSGVQLIIFGSDGSVLKSGMSEADTDGGSESSSSFRGVLPLSQSYILRVQAGDEPVEYSMNIVIPRRISFASGAFSASDKRHVMAHSSLHYTAWGRAGQTMMVEVDANKPVQLIIYGMDGDVLMSGMGEGASFKGELPSSQDYLLVVRAADATASYKITVTIK